MNRTALDGVANTFIVITPRSTMVWVGFVWFGLVWLYGVSPMLVIQCQILFYTYIKYMVCKHILEKVKGWNSSISNDSINISQLR